MKVRRSQKRSKKKPSPCICREGECRKLRESSPKRKSRIKLAVSVVLKPGLKLVLRPDLALAVALLSTPWIILHR